MSRDALWIMSTVLTHALVGAAMTQAAPVALRRGGTAVALAVAAVAPDADVVAFHLGVPYAHPLGHRGLSHSIVFAALVALLGAALLTRARSFAGHFRPLAILLFIAVVSHGLLDAATDAGLGVGFFVPFDDARFFFPFRPLAAPAVSPTTFLAHRGRALEVLGRELVWVWLPVLAVSLLLRLAALRSATPRGGARRQR